MIEVELKCDLSSALWPRLQEKLQATEFCERVTNYDVYYDTWSFDLLRQAVFVRVRNHRQLQFKFNTEQDKAHTHCVERTFSLPLDPVSTEEANTLFARFLPEWINGFWFEKAIEKNDLTELAFIENARETYSMNNMYISIDHVKDLGEFLEIEIHGEEGGNTGEALTKLKTFASDINIEPVNLGYVEMWLRKHNPLAYQQGRYRL
ncbi:MAG: CYTH domain-containing protein [Ktedonobacteraceae bacterium]